MEMQNEEIEGFRPVAIVAGGILLVLGTAMFLDTTGAVDIRVGRMIAPLILIGLGTSMVLGRSAFVVGHRPCAVAGFQRHRLQRKGSAASGIWLIGIGAWMLVSQNHIFGLNYGNSWPLFIILSGVITVIRGVK